MKTCPQCGYTKTDNRVKVPSSDYGEIERLYSIEGLTLQEIGDRYGVTRERIRQILPRGASNAQRVRRYNQKRTTRFLAACQRALDMDLKCKTCGGWILRMTTGSLPPMNCSADCSQAYLMLRHFDDHEGHRREMALTLLASPEKYKQSQLDWAEAILGPDPPPPNRRFLIPGSKRAQMIAKYRPEQYAALTGGSDE